MQYKLFISVKSQKSAVKLIVDIIMFTFAFSCIASSHNLRPNDQRLK